jgi:hypothetical protein
MKMNMKTMLKHTNKYFKKIQQRSQVSGSTKCEKKNNKMKKAYLFL